MPMPMTCTTSALRSSARPAPNLPWYARGLLWITRGELPGWGRLYAATGGECDARWRDAGIGRVRGKLHGYELELDLANWSERLSWFLGRYHDLPIQQAMARVLRTGDAFLDVGANLGQLTLLARALVGDRGAVTACEPNPRALARLRHTLATNGLHDVVATAVACSDHDGTAVLREFAGHPGWGSLTDTGPEGASTSGQWRVACRRGDELVAQLPAAMPLAIKIDVEGHELPVLRGLEHTLATRRPLLFVEVIDSHLRRAGNSAAALLAVLARHGYRGFALADRRRFGFRHGVRFAAFTAGDPCGADVLCVPTDGPWAQRLQSLLHR